MKIATTIFALSLGGLAVSPASAQTKWDMPTAYPDGNFHTMNAKTFAETVKTKTNGKVDIVIHAGASLFKANEIKRAVQTGQAPLGEVLMVNLENEDKIFGLDGVPFLATNYAQARKLADAARPVIERKLDAQGLKLLYTVPWPPQGIYVHKALEGVKDMEGLKWRAYSPATARLGELVKAQPVTVQAAELSQALTTGKVNSFISSGATGVDSKVWEQLSHFYDTKAWLPKNMVIVNKEAFEKLDKTAQAILVEEAKTAEKTGWAESERLAQGYLETLAKNGMKVQPPNPQFAKELADLGKIMTEDWAKAAGQDGEMILQQYRK